MAGRHDEMDVIGHQRVGMDLHAVSQGSLAERRRKELVVGEGSKDCAAIGPSLDYMLTETGELDTALARHGRWPCEIGAGRDSPRFPKESWIRPHEVRGFCHRAASRHVADSATLSRRVQGSDPCTT